jgi:outer membrane lipoprotein-sorting protein
MKKLFTLLALVITLISSAQAPQGFNYQAIVRNTAGQLLLNQSVSFKFSILQNSDTGTVVYSENQTANTDDLGHIALVVGQGTATIGTFSSINWANGTYYLT